jgi:exopolyphosphatase/guanosine-5'-triphosphate,3'-diphosphate pyrophosphatase
LFPARILLDIASAARAEALGLALRLAFSISAGTCELLAGNALFIQQNTLVLRMRNNFPYDSEAISRRTEALAHALGLEAVTELVDQA